MKALFTGLVKAYASENNPLQTIVEFILTDFLPNRNKQRIPETEAQNIIASAQHMPIKINYSNDKIKGHAMSVPIGTLAEVWQEDEVIKARSIIWKAEYPEIDEHLRFATSEGKAIGTSWEILYTEAEEKNGISDLHGCIVQATTIVDNPAYGDRTRILSLAESFDYMDELEQMRSAFAELLYLIDSVYAEVMQREMEKTAIENASTALERLQELVSTLRTSKAEAENILVSEKIALEDRITALTARIETLESEKAQAENEKAQAEIASSRRTSLANAGVNFSDEEFNQRRNFYTAMAEEVFTEYVNDLTRVSRSIQIKVPDTLGTSKRSAKEIAQAIKEVK